MPTRIRAIHFFKNYAESENGAVIVVAALLFPLMLGLGGLGVDLSMWLQQQRKLQTAADAAALAAAHELAYGRSESDAQSAGIEEAIKNGYSTAGRPFNK